MPHTWVKSMDSGTGSPAPSSTSNLSLHGRIGCALSRSSGSVTLDCRLHGAIMRTVALETRVRDSCFYFPHTEAAA